MHRFPLFRARRERDPLWKREARGRWRSPWTFVVLGLYAAMLGVLARVFYGALVPQGDILPSKFSLGLGAPLFWKFVGWQIAGWIPLGLILAAPSLSLERERGTLPDYVLAGLSGRQIVRAKWMSLASFAAVLVVAPLPIAALCFPLGGVSGWDFASANALCIGVALSSCALGFSISANHKTVSGAYVAAVGAAFKLGLLACPLLFLASSLPFWLLWSLAIGLALIPFRVVPRVQEEFEWLATRLETEAPRTPDYEDRATPFAQLQLERAALALAEAEGQTRAPLRSEELALWMNAAQVERGRLDPPPSKFDLQLQGALAQNPLAERDVQLQLRAWRRSLVLSDSDPMPSFSPLASCGAGLALSFIGCLVPPVAVLWAWLFLMGALAALVQIALLAANGFARERRAHMITQLQLSALSPQEVVLAKFVAPLLLSARFWAYPLLILGLGSLALGPLWMGIRILVALALCQLASALGNLMSLRLRHVTVSASASLGALFVLLVVLPVIFQPLLFHAPRWLEVWWLAPLRVLLSSGGDSFPLARLFVSLQVLSFSLLGACLRCWKRVRDETK